MVKNIFNQVISKLKQILNWFKKASIKKKLLVVVVVLLVAYLLMKSFGGDGSEISYKTEPVKNGTIVNIVSETGEITTTAVTEVDSTITGIVQEVFVDNGEVVKRGQSLFKVESTATEQERALAYSNYLSAKATLELAESNQYAYQADMFEDWDEFRELAESDEFDTNEERALPEFHAPEKDWLAAEAKYKSQAQVIAQAKAAVNNKWLLYQATIDGIVKSTANGTVANLAVAMGQHVDTDTTALMVKSGEATWVELAINETDIETIEPGQLAVVTVDALKDAEYKGTVERVDSVGAVESGVVTYNVYISLPELEQIVMPGMTVEVDIETQRQENVLIVPNSAIKPYQGGKAVQVIDEKTGQVIYYPVEVGIVGPTKSEIISGISEGQEIVVTQTDNGEKTQGGGGGMFPPGH